MSSWSVAVRPNAGTRTMRFAPTASCLPPSPGSTAETFANDQRFICSGIVSSGQAVAGGTERLRWNASFTSRAGAYYRFVSRIDLVHVIPAPRERLFDLARSIDAHIASTPGTDERAVG